jgi:hypothetical protein
MTNYFVIYIYYKGAHASQRGKGEEHKIDNLLASLGKTLKAYTSMQCPKQQQPPYNDSHKDILPTKLNMSSSVRGGLICSLLHHQKVTHSKRLCW